MRSRVLIGVAAWLLGAACATGGSLLAVDQLAHGILHQPGQPQAAAAVNAELANKAAARASSRSSPHAASQPRSPQQRIAKPPRANTLLTSPNGTVVASCGAAGAYLLYWSPQQGYQADDVARGPAPVASVTFRDSSGGVVMRISCQGSTPVARVSAVPSWADDGHDE